MAIGWDVAELLERIKQLEVENERLKGEIPEEIHIVYYTEPRHYKSDRVYIAVHASEEAAKETWCGAQRSDRWVWSTKLIR